MINVRVRKILKFLSMFKYCWCTKLRILKYKLVRVLRLLFKHEIDQIIMRHSFILFVYVRVRILLHFFDDQRLLVYEFTQVSNVKLAFLKYYES